MTPALSVIVPTLGRMGRLRACLDALATQTQLTSDFEVVVVIDGGTESTGAMLAALQTPYLLKVVRQENRGAGAARNRGVQEATGRVCLFLDDDIIATPDLVATHLTAHQQDERIVGIGRILLEQSQSTDWFAQEFARAWERHYRRLRDGATAPGWGDCYSGNLSIRREHFVALGGFTEDLGRMEDDELGYRLLGAGLTPLYLERAVGVQDERKGAPELLADARRAGETSVLLYRRHPGMLPDLPLGMFWNGGWRQALARRWLLRLRVPANVLAWLGPVAARLGVADRWYSFLYLLSYWAGVRSATSDVDDLWRRLTSGTTILMYHAFGAPGEPASRFVIPKSRFARQIRWLKRLGYRVITIEELVRCREENRLPPPRSVAITIDDGFADVFDHALPVLAGSGVPATVFVVTGRVGESNDWDRTGPLAGRRLLSWDQLAELGQRNVQIGAHTRTHPLLTALSEDGAEDEILGSGTDIRSRLGRSPGAFAYPYGKMNSHVARVAEGAGFRGICGTEDGFNTAATSPLSLRRAEVYGTDSLLRFLSILWLGRRLRWRRLWQRVGRLRLAARPR